jgi:hypothetical protein
MLTDPQLGCGSLKVAMEEAVKWLASLVLVPCQGLVVKAIVVLATLKLKKEEDKEWKDTVINRMFSVTRACTFLKSNSQILMKQVILGPHMVRKGGKELVVADD